MKERLLHFLHELVFYDYLLFLGIFTVFIILVVVALLFHKKMVLSILLILLAFATIFIAPFVGYSLLHQKLDKNSVQITSYNRLEFAPVVVIHATLSNLSNHAFKRCRIEAAASKHSKYAMINKIFAYNPFISSEKLIETPIEVNQSVPVKMVLAPFHYEKEFDVSITAQCH